uniref:Uncharacterized protein n=1 Tax=Anguilla anguilla TaxID=7936 RepID=A0A0E9PMB1_ANGAN
MIISCVCSGLTVLLLLNIFDPGVTGTHCQHFLVYGMNTFYIFIHT